MYNGFKRLWGGGVNMNLKSQNIEKAIDGFNTIYKIKFKQWLLIIFILGPVAIFLWMRDKFHNSDFFPRP